MSTATPAHEVHDQGLASPAKRGFGAVVGEAFSDALALPIVAARVLLALTRKLSRVPLFGWVLAIYGLAAVVIAAIALAVAIPCTMLIALAIRMLRR